MENSRAQAALSLAVGTASSFGIAMTSTAVVARLYRPAAFGDFAEFMAWMALPAAVGTLRISDAIPLTKSSEAERRTIQGALEILLLIATLGGVIAIIIPVDSMWSPSRHHGGSSHSVSPLLQHQASPGSPSCWRPSMAGSAGSQH